MAGKSRANWLVAAVGAVTSIMCSAAPLQFKLKASCASLVDHAMASGAWLMTVESGRIHVLASESDDEELKPILTSRPMNELLMRRIRAAGAKAEASLEPAIVRNFDAMGVARDFVAVPLVLSGGVAGILCCMFRKDSLREDDELQSLEVVGRLFAMSLHVSSEAAVISVGDEVQSGEGELSDLDDLRLQAARIEPIIRSLPGAIVFVQPNGLALESIPGSPSAIQPPMRKVAGQGWVFNFVSEHANNQQTSALSRALRGEPSSCVFQTNDWTGSSEGLRVVEQTFSPVLDANGDVKEVVGFTQDVTQREHMNDLLRHLRERDAITDCMTMHALRDQAERELSEYSSTGMPIAFFSIEIDKSGAGVHLLGPNSFEELLRTVVARIRKHLPRIHVLARRGDHSFVAFANLDVGSAMPAHENGDDYKEFSGAAAQRIVQVLSEPIVTGRHEYFIGVNVGHCVYPIDGTTVDELLYNCDIAAMTSGAKQSSGALAFSPNMAIEANERVRIETALHCAVDREEFTLAYQPKINLSDGNVSGVEALIRWPGRAPISPAKFIPIAEECGLISFIGEWALRHACNTAANWASCGMRIPISVNVSTRQFHDSDFQDIVREVLRETGCDPELLELEVTEGVMIRDIDKVIDSFRKLREIGVKLSIDDFGTGFSSLAYLKNLPVNTLKIDRAFVHNLPRSAENEAITKAVLAMAGALGLRTVAEGVEDLECLKHLRLLGCDEVQGYYFSQPLIESDFMAWYAAYETVRRASLAERIPTSQTYQAEPIN